MSLGYVFKSDSPSEKWAFFGRLPSVLLPLNQAQTSAWWESSLPLRSRDTWEKRDPIDPSEVPQSLAARSGRAFLS